MTYAPATTLIAASVLVATLALSAAAVSFGIVPDDAIQLWAAASMAGGGGVPIGRIIATYPSIPFLSTTVVTLVAPDGAPVPALVSASLVALMAGWWVALLRSLKLNTGVAITVAILIALHPLSLRALLSGPAEAFLVLFLFVLGRALYDLRARSASPEVMAVGLALLLLAFSHPIGAAIAFASVPFLVLAVRPALVANFPFNVVLVLVFPTVFAVAAFSYVSWVIPGASWSFIAAPAERLSAWSEGMAHVLGNGISGYPAIDAALATALVLVVAAPIVPAALVLVHRRRVLLTPGLVLVAATVAAAAIAVATGLFGDPSIVMLAAPALAAVVVTRMPIVHERPAMLVALLISGWIGGASTLVLLDPAAAAQLRAAFDGGDRERIDALDAGAATAGRDGVLVDTDNAPAFVVGRGHGRGVVNPASGEFALVKRRARLEAAPLVAVPDPQSSIGAGDQLNRSFPTLFRQAAPGYRLIYQNDTWRIFERANNDAVDQD